MFSVCFLVLVAITAQYSSSTYLVEKIVQKRFLDPVFNGNVGTYNPVINGNVYIDSSGNNNSNNNMNPNSGPSSVSHTNINQQSAHIRLVNGGARSGRVEIFHNGQWGTICDDSWSYDDATVVCKMLGYSGIGAIPRTRAYYGNGSGRIWMDNVYCDGSEQTIVDCFQNGWSKHNCDHSEDAGVDC